MSDVPPRLGWIPVLPIGSSSPRPPRSFLRPLLFVIFFATLAGGVADGVQCGRHISCRSLCGAGEFSNSNFNCFDSGTGDCFVFLDRFALSSAAEEAA